MIPAVKIVSQISSDQSVICILGSNSIPDYLALSKSERQYALKRLSADEEYVFINSYSRCIYLVSLKKDLPDHRIKEELRKTASKMKKLIRSNDHSELVISSSSAPGRIC